jgi:FkbM family methyltransferase
MNTKHHLELIETAFGPVYARRGDFVNNQLREFGAHQRSDLAMLLSLVQKDDRVIDVGAHIGTFSLPISSVVGSGGRVCAFEAVPGNYEILVQNIELNRKQQIIYPMLELLSDGKERYNISIDHQHSSAAHFSLAKKRNKSSRSSQTLDMWYAQQDVINRVDIIKIDTEGMELSVLIGSQNIIHQYRPILFLEISARHLRRQNHRVRDLEEFLRPYGYHFFKNLHTRNARNDDFRIGRLWRLSHGGAFYDLLAVHPHDSRYPVGCTGGLSAVALTLLNMPRAAKRRILAVLSSIRRQLGRITAI